MVYQIKEMKTIGLIEGKVFIEVDGKEVSNFLTYHEGSRKIYHLKSFNQIIQKWIKGVKDPKLLTSNSLYHYTRKHYPKMTVFTEEDMKRYRDFKKFMKKSSSSS